MPISTVKLVNAVFYAHHGVMQEEHRLGGRFEVDVSMDLDVTDAATHDDLSGTVDYERIYRIVQQVVLHNRFYLIERLAYLIAGEVMTAYPAIQSIEVTVRKPNPPVGGTVDRAEVVYRAVREA